VFNLEQCTFFQEKGHQTRTYPFIHDEFPLMIMNDLMDQFTNHVLMMDLWQRKMVHASIGETRISLQILAHDELVFKVCGTCYNIWSASLDFGFI
jgi:hypothetical protein